MMWKFQINNISGIGKEKINMLTNVDAIRTGKTIKCYMKQNGFTPADIQRYLSLSCVQTIYRWLRGKAVPSVDNLYALSTLFGVSLDDIIQGNRHEVSCIFMYNKVITYFIPIKNITKHLVH